MPSFIIKTEVECQVICDGEVVCVASPSNNQSINLQGGMHHLSFVDMNNSDRSYDILYEVVDIVDDYIEVRADYFQNKNQARVGVKSVDSKEWTRLINFLQLGPGLSENERELRMLYYDGVSPYDLSPSDMYYESLLRAPLPSRHVFETSFFTVQPWNCINDMLNTLFRPGDGVDGYTFASSGLSFYQKDWERVDESEDWDSVLIHRMEIDNILIMKALLTFMAIKESKNEYPIELATFPDVKGHMDYAKSPKFQIDLSVKSGVIRSNRLLFLERPNAFQSFWPSFYNEVLVMDLVDSRRHFLELSMIYLQGYPQREKLITELRQLAIS